MRTKAPSWAVFALVVLAAASVSGLKARPAAQAASPPLTPLKGVDELKGWFNANRVHPRLVLLLSPT